MFEVRALSLAHHRPRVGGEICIFFPHQLSTFCFYPVRCDICKGQHISMHEFLQSSSCPPPLKLCFLLCPLVSGLFIFWQDYAKSAEQIGRKLECDGLLSTQSHSSFLMYFSSLKCTIINQLVKNSAIIPTGHSIINVHFYPKGIFLICEGHGFPQYLSIWRSARHRAIKSLLNICGLTHGNDRTDKQG